MSDVRRVFRQHWSEYAIAAVPVVVAPVAIWFVPYGGTVSRAMWSVLLVSTGLLLVRPRLVADDAGLTVTQVIGRRRTYRWGEIDAVTARPGSGANGVVDACVVVRLHGRRGADAMEDLPWLPTADARRGRVLASARRRHSLAVMEALQERLAAWRSAQGTPGT